MINNVLHTKKSKEFTKEIVNNNVTVANPAEMADVFNNYFVDICTTLSRNIPEPNKRFQYFLKNPNPKTIFLTPITEYEVKNIVNNLKPKKSPGCDELTNFVIKRVINEILTPLTFIFNQSLVTGLVPQNMKVAKVVPVFKKGDRRIVSNYRPISLLTSLSKILERLIYSRLIDFFIYQSYFMRFPIWF